MTKTLIATVTLFFIAFTASAQFKLGVKAGGSLDNQRINLNEGNYFSGTDVKGFHAGLIAEWQLSEHLYIQPQLLYNRKGAQHLSANGAGDARVKLHYAELPVNLLYKFDVASGYIFLGTGATLSYALAGNSIQNGHSENFFGKQSDWRREDVSLNFTAGYEFNNGLFVSLNSQKGMLDINRSAAARVKNKSMSVSVGYIIDWKRLSKRG